MKLHTDATNFSALLASTAAATGIHPPFVEKDYWLTTVLRELSRSPYRSIAVFKGGTSLSKAYGIIQRFSEDVDLALIVDGLSGNQIKSRIDRIAKSITRHLPEVHLEDVTSKGSRFRRTAHTFPALAEKLVFPSQAREELVLEINAFANPFPHQEVQLESLITTHLRQLGHHEAIQQFELEPFSLQVLRPERTLAEKVLALARASYHAQPLEQLQDKIRHTYDLYFLLQQPDLQAFVASKDFFGTLRLVQVDDARNSEFQGEWAAQPLAAAWIYQDDPDLWQALGNTYTGSFRSLVYGPIPSLQAIRAAFSQLAIRLLSFEQ
ncbi:MAG: nucleotidyl transferase AbiEii/AbiGii toxin family protein [Candidatus Sericytochromatia bacterium]